MLRLFLLRSPNTRGKAVPTAMAGLRTGRGARAPGRCPLPPALVAVPLPNAGASGPRVPCWLGYGGAAPGSAALPHAVAAPPLPGPYKPLPPAPSERLNPPWPQPSRPGIPCSMAWNTNLRWRLPLTCLLLQAALVVLFGVFVRYSPDADAHWIEEKGSGNVSSDLDNEFYYRYPSKSCPPAGPPSAHPTELVPTWPRALPGRTCSAYLSVEQGGSQRRRLSPLPHPTRHWRSPAGGDHAGAMARCVLFPP